MSAEDLAAPEGLVVDDQTFLENAREANENGYDRLCARCGTGTYDGFEIHERACPEYVEFRP